MYDEFAKWLDRILDENMPLPGVAINFNIYEAVSYTHLTLPTKA